MGTGQLCLHLLQVTGSAASELYTFSFSAVSQLLPLCQASSFTSIVRSCCHHRLAKGGLSSPAISILGAQRCQVACPSHTAGEDQSRTSPSCDSKPSALPTTTHQPRCHQRFPLKRRRMRFFLFLKHIWNEGQTSSHICTRVDFYS